MKQFAIKLATILLILTPVTYATDFSDLTADQTITEFSVRNIYTDESDKPIGGRFIHQTSGFVLDLVRIQSVPQAFVWVNSPPPSDQGEPHTCEHLLLGKGTKGRYVGSLEGMSLGRSSAFTMQLQTCYHFHTSAGDKTFFNLFEAKLDAMINPTFTDEDVRREVCNIGYTVDPVDSTVTLEEKGTIYNEMSSGFERPNANLYRALGHMVYGTKHPLAMSSGGYPPAVRTMQPEDMTKFINETYHLNNMGAVITISDKLSIDDCLLTLSEIFERVEPNAMIGDDPTTLDERLGPPVPSPRGEIRLTEYPSRNEQEPGSIVYLWSPDRPFDWDRSLLLELFIEGLASGQSSELYKKFINSQTRDIDIGASYTYAYISDEPGHPVYIGISNVKQEFINERMIDSLRSVIIEEFSKIANFEDNSEELKQFNARAIASVNSTRRSLRDFLNRPPGFGTRGTGAGWFGHLQLLSKSKKFRKCITMNERLDRALESLNSPTNIWRELVANWHFVDSLPYAAASIPSPALIEKEESEKQQRIASFTESLKTKYAVDNDKSAIALYVKEYDQNTAIIENAAASLEMPEFVNNPPLTLDQSINYSTEKLPGKADLVYSRFDNISLAYAGLAFNLDVIPESLLIYAASLPMMLNSVGLVKEGRRYSTEQLEEILQNEISGLSTYFSANNRTQRSELVISASGSNLEESKKALEWISATLFTPDWSDKNLTRIRDAIDQSLSSFCNRMRRSEESWVQDPAAAYWRQSNPLMLATNSFLTRGHFVHRVRWIVKQADDKQTEKDFSDFMSAVKDYGLKHGRVIKETLLTLNRSEIDMNSVSEEELKNLYTLYSALTDNGKELVDEAFTDLSRTLLDIPDNSFATDWGYLCDQMVTDLQTAPSIALDGFKQVLDLIRHQDNYRAFLVCSEENKTALMPILSYITSKLSSSPSVRQNYDVARTITTRYKERAGISDEPLFVGLINENTRSGVFVNTTECANFADTSEQTLLKFLSARLYGGWGAHSMFMKTWGAGLAYSNGLRHDENSGRLLYYAERCPDLAQTMQFVVNELKNAPYDPALADYAIAQAFYMSRDASRYETRGESLAEDIADGYTPEVISRFRQKVLDLRKLPDLYAKLHELMPKTYGEVLPGYGPKAESYPSAHYFVIGPEKQLESFQDYINAVEGDYTLHTLYPRDFWMIH